MFFFEHLAEFHSLPVFDFPDRGEAQTALPAPDAVAWRLAVNPFDDRRDESFRDLWDRFLGAVEPAGIRALVIGQWGQVYDSGSEEVVESLVAARDRLTGVRAVFLGDLVVEEAEISWIQQSDVTPVLTAYPALRELGIRGGTALRFPAVRHESLRRLVIESGGLPGEVVRGVAASDLPALEHLELWLGVDEYGGDATVGDLEPILAGSRLPALRDLALRNSELQDEIAAAVAAAPVVARLTSLDLSLGALSDDGATALLEGQPLTHLGRLDLHHHFISDAVAQRVQATLGSAGVEVDLSEPEAPEEENRRYVAISE